MTHFILQISGISPWSCGLFSHFKVHGASGLKSNCWPDAYVLFLEIFQKMPFCPRSWARMALLIQHNVFPWVYMCLHMCEWWWIEWEERSRPYVNTPSVLPLIKRRWKSLGSIISDEQNKSIQGGSEIFMSLVTIIYGKVLEGIYSSSVKRITKLWDD